MNKSLETSQTLSELVACVYAGFASIAALIIVGFWVVS